MTTPAEGVKLEPVGWRWRFMNGEWNWFDGAFKPNGPLDADDEVQLLYGPQAAKRIEELEAEVEELNSIANSLARAGKAAGDKAIASEARALKAERQRDEAVGALEEIASRPFQDEPRTADGHRNRCPSCAHAWPIDRDPHHSPTCDRIIARSVLTSIREG